MARVSIWILSAVVVIESACLLTLAPWSKLHSAEVEELGHGYWTMNTEVMGSWEVIHYTRLFWRNVDLGDIEWANVSPSGRHVAYQDGSLPATLVFHPASYSIDTLSRVTLVEGKDVRWNEPSKLVVLAARRDRPERSIRLDLHRDEE